MSFTTPQVESRIEFSPLPQDADVEQGHNQIIEDKDRNIAIEIEPCEERFDWEAFMIVLRLALVSMLLVGLALRQRQSGQPTSYPIPPTFSINSLHVPLFKISYGELSLAWDFTLSISNVMNSSNINIIRLDAAVSYKENKTLAMVTPIAPQYEFQRKVFIVEAEKMKRVNLKLSTTGWENDQPIVDDFVIQAIAEDMQRGVSRFVLQMRVVGEVEFGDQWVADFAMYPNCNDLEVKFVAADKEGKAATIIDYKPRECVGLIEWDPVRSSLQRLA